MSVSKIVITGGPCAGKTTALSWIQNTFEKEGYTVLFIEETATELIKGGISPASCGTNMDFQRCLMELQMKREQVFERAAASMGDKKILIVCDRGAIDNKVYMTSDEFKTLLAELGTNEVELEESYDAVFHLVSAAKGAEEYYTHDNNAARTETPAQAAELDDKLIAAWTGHTHFRVIDNSTDFKGKLQRLMAEINAALGEPEPFEIERKFLIAYPDIQALESMPNCSKVEIIQTYLNSPDGHEIRVRQRGRDGGYAYFRTEKYKINELKRIEVESRLTESKYLDCLMDADTSKHQIRKTRYCLTYGNHYFEIDVYPFWKDRAIIEIELKSEDEKFEIPGMFNVIREVTGDHNYKNTSLAAMDAAKLPL